MMNAWLLLVVLSLVAAQEIEEESNTTSSTGGERWRRSLRTRTIEECLRKTRPAPGTFIAGGLVCECTYSRRGNEEDSDSRKETNIRYDQDQQNHRGTINTQFQGGYRERNEKEMSGTNFRRTNGNHQGGGVLPQEDTNIPFKYRGPNTGSKTENIGREDSSKDESSFGYHEGQIHRTSVDDRNIWKGGGYNERSNGESHFDSNKGIDGGHKYNFNSGHENRGPQLSSDWSHRGQSEGTEEREIYSRKNTEKDQNGHRNSFGKPLGEIQPGNIDRTRSMNTPGEHSRNINTDISRDDNSELTYRRHNFRVSTNTGNSGVGGGKIQVSISGNPKNTFQDGERHMNSQGNNNPSYREGYGTNAGGISVNSGFEMRASGSGVFGSNARRDNPQESGDVLGGVQKSSFGSTFSKPGSYGNTDRTFDMRGGIDGNVGKGNVGAGVNDDITNHGNRNFQLNERGARLPSGDRHFSMPGTGQIDIKSSFSESSLGSHVTNIKNVDPSRGESVFGSEEAKRIGLESGSSIGGIMGSNQGRTPFGNQRSNGNEDVNSFNLGRRDVKKNGNEFGYSYNGGLNHEIDGKFERPQIANIGDHVMSSGESVSTGGGTFLSTSIGGFGGKIDRKMIGSHNLPAGAGIPGGQHEVQVPPFGIADSFRSSGVGSDATGDSGIGGTVESVGAGIGANVFGGGGATIGGIPHISHPASIGVHEGGGTFLSSSIGGFGGEIDRKMIGSHNLPVGTGIPGGQHEVQVPPFGIADSFRSSGVGSDASGGSGIGGTAESVGAGIGANVFGSGGATIGGIPHISHTGSIGVHEATAGTLNKGFGLDMASVGGSLGSIGLGSSSAVETGIEGKPDPNKDVEILSSKDTSSVSGSAETTTQPSDDYEEEEDNCDEGFEFLNKIFCIFKVIMGLLFGNPDPCCPLEIPSLPSFG